MLKRNSEQRDSNSSVSNFKNLDENVFISDKYYQKQTFKLNELTSSFNSTNENKDGRQVEYVPININESRDITLYKENHDLQDLEEFLKVSDLNILKKIFIKAIKDKADFIYKFANYDLNDFQKKHAESLKKEEFLSALSTLSLFSNFKDEFEQLFDKLDTKGLGCVNFNDFCSYLMIKYKEKEFYESLKAIPFNNALNVKHSLHNKRDVTIKMLYLENPWRFINISRHGSIGLWTKKFNFIKKFTIPSEDESLFHRNTVRLFDAILLKENNRMCVSTTKRNLRIFKISAEYLNEEFIIFGFDHSLTCLDYSFSKQENDSFLIAGDSAGGVHVFHFFDPIKSLYNEVHKPIKEIFRINIKEDMADHKNFVNHKYLNAVHKDSVTNVRFIRTSLSIVSASNDVKNSVVISDPSRTKDAYSFSHSKGCVCFDYNLNFHMLVSASVSPLIFVWNLYVPQKPVSRLRGHNATVIGLKIHSSVSFLYSLSTDAVLKAWDLKQETLLQTIHLEFPCDLRVAGIEEYGPNPLLLYSDKNENGLLLACFDYIGTLPIGENIKLEKDIPLSHTNPITCMVYCSLFKMVITCTEDSKITFWNLISGRKITTIQNAHDKQEITCCKLDNSDRHLFTAANNGSIKAWNVLDGTVLQIFQPSDSKEVTSLVIIEQKKILLTVGWNKKIMIYNIQFDHPPIKPKNLWLNEYQHKNDIQCSDCFNTLLATGSIDGEINIWSVDSCTLLMNLKNNNKKIAEQTVDKLLFLKFRLSTLGYNTSILVSSQGGYLNFYDFSTPSHLCGSFYSSAFSDQCSLSITTDKLNKILISGDTKGFVYIWDISEYKINKINDSQKIPPCIKSWRAHDKSIESCEFISSSNGVYSGELLVTASSDWCCRLWTIDGIYIGVFGQELKWNLSNPKTFQESNCKNTEENKTKIEQIEESTDLTNYTFDGAKYEYLSKFKAFQIEESKLDAKAILGENI